MTEEYGHIPDGFLLNPEEVEELRNKKHELTEYGKQKLRKMMNDNPTIDEMLEIAEEREEANRELEKEESERKQRKNADK